jgi:DNA repair exonuclease SbcCD nuclease subunit
MKYLLVGDPHFGGGNIEDTQLLEKEINRVIEEEKPDEVVLLGDVHDRYDVEANSRANEWITERLCKKIRVTLIVGNHERKDNTDYHSKVHHYVGMEKDGLRIVSETVKVGNVIYVPYVRPGMFQAALNHAGGIKNVKWIFAHQAFIGCCDLSALDEWNNSSTRVVSGHIHTRMSLSKGIRQQQVLDKGWNVYYPGSSTCTTFLDTQDRVLCIVEDDSIREVVIESCKRRVMTLTTDFTDEDIDMIRTSDKYTRITIIGTYAECTEMQDTELIREAKKRGSVINTHQTDKGGVSEGVVVGVSKPFCDDVVSKMSEKWTKEELAYLIATMRG